MTVEAFIAACRAKGYHFTANWVARRYRDIEHAHRGQKMAQTNLELNSRVRIVDMRGCMGEVRHNPRMGTIVDFHAPLGSDYLYVNILMDDGTHEKRVATPGLWSTRHDGIPEYQE